MLVPLQVPLAGDPLLEEKNVQLVVQQHLVNEICENPPQPRHRGRVVIQLVRWQGKFFQRIHKDMEADPFTYS